MKRGKEIVYQEPERKKYLQPLLRNILRKRRRGKTAIIGIQGGPGTGKTTLARFLQQQLQHEGCRAEAFSIDDFYETYEKRKKLAKRHAGNPFYQISRGMPGTHRVGKLRETLDNIKAGRPFIIPEFDKSRHHGAGEVVAERKVKSRVDFVLFEGWCVGLPAVSVQKLARICARNRIDLRKMDPQLKYSRTMLRYSRQYQPLWKYLDYIIKLKPESSNLHLKWRLQQEGELSRQKSGGMNKKQVEHFVRIYLPLTYACYSLVQADTTLLIDRRHAFYSRQ